MKGVITIVSLLICILSCNHKVDIAGHWRPADAFQTNHNSNGGIPQSRDLILNTDSTFISVGLDQQPKKTEGWHTDATQKGKWSFTGGILSLTIQDISYPVKFKVLKLTKEEMIMESDMMKSVELKLIRIKK